MPKEARSLPAFSTCTAYERFICLFDNVTAVAPTFSEARDRAYEACTRISFDGMFYSRDIGLRALAALDG